MSALKHCATALKLDSSNANYKAMHLMGNILQSLGKTEKGEEYFGTLWVELSGVWVSGVGVSGVEVHALVMGRERTPYSLLALLCVFLSVLS